RSDLAHRYSALHRPRRGSARVLSSTDGIGDSLLVVQRLPLSAHARHRLLWHLAVPRRHRSIGHDSSPERTHPARLVHGRDRVPPPSRSDVVQTAVTNFVTNVPEAASFSVVPQL